MKIELILVEEELLILDGSGDVIGTFEWSRYDRFLPSEIADTLVAEFGRAEDEPE